MIQIVASSRQWVKFALASLIIIFFVFWMWNFWLLLLLPLAFDIYITKKIPFTWWKKIKNNHIRKIFEWLDAIIFALVAVYFINLYFFQNYKIPSGSLEKTLLIGDHLFVSKLAYGPRTPNTPLSFPLVQHTFPVINAKSYVEGVQWKSRRLAGMGEVERNDIVVFNFPAGDTVALKRQEEDYEKICFREGLNNLLLTDTSVSPGIELRSRSLAIGRELVQQNKEKYGEIVYRPVDRRENYVKRCVGLPGDTLQIVDRELYIDGKKQERQPDIQFFCTVVTSQPLSEEIYDNLAINANERGIMLHQTTSDEYVFLLPLTAEKQEALRQVPFVKSVTERNMNEIFNPNPMYPMGYSMQWTEDNYGPIWIPKAGTSIVISSENLPLYERVIRNYEGNKLEVKEGKIFINDKESDTYTFAQDYYFMMGDNRHNSADSRSWGFVPADHVVGKPLFIWLSLNQDKGWFDGKIRWDRFFKYAGE